MSKHLNTRLLDQNNDLNNNNNNENSSNVDVDDNQSMIPTIIQEIQLKLQQSSKSSSSTPPTSAKLSSDKNNNNNSPFTHNKTTKPISLNQFDDNNNNVTLSINQNVNQNQNKSIKDSNNNISNNNSTIKTSYNSASTASTTTSSFTPQILKPEILESLHKSDHFPTIRHRWNTNEEIAALLISIDQHEKWLSEEVKLRPKSGSMLLYSRKHVRYRRDGYCWKKRKDGKTTREDHMKLKVQGIECIYGCYVHSAILPTFHRRCYWLLQNPDIVLVHYLNVPYNDDNKMISPSLNSLMDTRKEWTREDLVLELKPMFFTLNEKENGEIGDELEHSTLDTIEQIVQQLLIKQRVRLKTIEQEAASNQLIFNNTNHNYQTSITMPNDLLSMRMIKNSDLKNDFSNFKQRLSDQYQHKANIYATHNFDSINGNRQQPQQLQNIQTHQIFTSLSSGQIMDAQTLTTTRQESSIINDNQKNSLTTSSSKLSPIERDGKIVSTSNEIIDINGNSNIVVNNNDDSSLHIGNNTPKTNSIQLMQLTSANAAMCQLNRTGTGNNNTPSSTSINHNGQRICFSQQQHHHHPNSIKIERASTINQPLSSTQQHHHQQQQSTSLILNMSQIQSSFIIVNQNSNNNNNNDNSSHNNQPQINLSTNDENNNNTLQSNNNSGPPTPITFVAYRHRTGSMNSSMIPTSANETTKLSVPSSTTITAHQKQQQQQQSICAFKVPINVGIRQQQLQQPDNQMFCALTNTKNSVMTPIFTTSTTINFSANDNNYKNNLITTVSNSISAMSNDNDDDISMAEIEMDPLSDLESRTFHLDDEESMLICTSNASTPEHHLLSQNNLNHFVNSNCNDENNDNYSNQNSRKLLMNSHGSNYTSHDHNNDADINNFFHQNSPSTANNDDETNFDSFDTLFDIDNDNSLMNCLHLDATSKSTNTSNANHLMSKQQTQQSTSHNHHQHIIGRDSLINPINYDHNDRLALLNNNIDNSYSKNDKNNQNQSINERNSSTIHHCRSLSFSHNQNSDSSKQQQHHSDNLMKISHCDEPFGSNHDNANRKDNNSNNDTNNNDDDNNHKNNNNNQNNDASTIDFMDHEEITTSDEILFNLDTFDMFGEFEHLDDHHHHQDATNDDLGNITATSINDNNNEKDNNNNSNNNVMNVNQSQHTQNNRTATIAANKINNTINNDNNSHIINSSCLIRPSSETYRKIQSIDSNLKRTDSEFEHNDRCVKELFWFDNDNKLVEASNSIIRGDTSRSIMPKSNDNQNNSNNNRTLVDDSTNETICIDNNNDDNNNNDTTPIDVTIDENGNLSITKTTRASAVAVNGLMNSMKTLTTTAAAATTTAKTMIQNYPLLKRQLSTANLFMIKNNNGSTADRDFQSSQQHHQQQQSSLSATSTMSLLSTADNDKTQQQQQQNKIFINNNNSFTLMDAIIKNSSGSNRTINHITTDQKDSNSILNQITDYSPEWCYTEGGIKVLVAGPWYNDPNLNNHYSILFDSIPVQTELVQNGLLRCFSPKHEPGLITLQVSCNDIIISNSVIFEYRNSVDCNNNNNNNEIQYSKNMNNSSKIKAKQERIESE